VFGFTTAVAVACAIIFGVVPALRSTRGDLAARLRDGQRAGRRTRGLDRGIVAVQVGLALLLLSSAGLLVATLQRLTASVGGSNPETLLVIQLDVRGTSHTAAELHTAVPALAERFMATPGVKSIARTFAVPLIYGGLPQSQLDVAGLENAPDAEVTVSSIVADAGYFGTLGLRVMAGRDFDTHDVVGSPKVAVISDNLARRLFAGRNPVGEHIGLRGSGGRDIEVVGVVADAKQVNLRAPAPETMYTPLAQASDNSDRAVWAVRTTVDLATIVPQLRTEILAALPKVRIRHVHPMMRILGQVLGRERALADLAVAFGLLALVLAAVGLYGVMAFQVSARTREIGVRMALGADRRQVVRMVIGQGLTIVALGVVIGVPIALLGARSLRALLYGISAFDPVPLLIGAGVLTLTGALASLIPSNSAAKVDPLVAIRAD
jgi:predicted permease